MNKQTQNCSVLLYKLQRVKQKRPITYLQTHTSQTNMHIWIENTKKFNFRYVYYGTGKIKYV